MRKRVWLFGIMLLAAAGAAGWYWRALVTDWLAERFPQVVPAVVKEPAPDPARYSRLKAELESKRQPLFSRSPNRTLAPHARQPMNKTLEIGYLKLGD